MAVGDLLFKDNKLAFGASGNLLFIPSGGSSSDCSCCGGSPLDPCTDCNTGFSVGTVSTLTVSGNSYNSTNDRSPCHVDYNTSGIAAITVTGNTWKWRRSFTIGAYSHVQELHLFKNCTGSPIDYVPAGVVTACKQFAIPDGALAVFYTQTRVSGTYVHYAKTLTGEIQCVGTPLGYTGSVDLYRCGGTAGCYATYADPLTITLS